MGRRGQWNFDQGVMMVVVSFLPSFRLMMMMTRLFIAGFIFCQGVGSCQQSETEVKSWEGGWGGAEGVHEYAGVLDFLLCFPVPYCCEIPNCVFLGVVVLFPLYLSHVLLDFYRL